MTDQDFNNLTEEEQYFERSGCGCLLLAAVASVAIALCTLLVIILNQ